jgi:hypothetical protein
MDYLTILQRLHTEAGRQGTTPASVLNLSGMNARLLDWVDDSYREIQLLHESWLFRRGDFTFDTSALGGGLTAYKQNYTASDASITDLAAWKYDPDHNQFSGIRIYSSVNDETDLVFVQWDDFRANYKFGSHRTQTGRPTIFSIKYDNSIDLWSIPDAVYTVNGEYIKQADTMSANDDEPVIPADFHMIIVWKALMFYGTYEGAPEIFDRGQFGYRDMLAKLEFDQLPKLVYGAPLA